MFGTGLTTTKVVSSSDTIKLGIFSFSVSGYFEVEKLLAFAKLNPFPTSLAIALNSMSYESSMSNNSIRQNKKSSLMFLRA